MKIAGKFVIGFRLLLMLAAGVAAAAGDWYVSTNGNDSWAGTNWDTAFSTISNGVAHAGGGQTVWVGAGTYLLSSQINVITNLALMGVGGASNTIVARDPAFTNRLIYMTHSGAVVDGFTLTNGLETTAAYGGGVSMTAGLLRNCLIVKNIDTDPGDRPYGGGVNATGGVISNCLIRANRSVGSYGKAGGLNVVNATVKHCVIESNYAQEYPANGGLIVAGASRVENCLFRANNGAALNAAGTTLIRNCTLVENTGGGSQPALYLGGSSTALNCIVYYNVAPDVMVAAPAVMQNSCSSNLISGLGNMTNAPLFADRAAGNFHLQAASPCIDRGVNGAWLPTDRDLDGNYRILHGIVDMGVYETPAGFGCNLASDRLTGFAPLTNILRGYVSGTNVQAIYYQWDVNADGVIDQQGWDKQVITNVYELPGLYSVALATSNEDGTVDSFTNVNYISVSTLAMYVSPEGNHTLPYASWATAATTIQAAVSFAADGGTIYLTNGLYVLTNTVVLSLGTTLKGINGAAATVVAGNGTEPCFAMNHGGAVLDGLTISNGYAILDGGGLTLTTGTVQNCIIRDNTASRYGGGVYLVNGLLKNCVITRNVSRGAVQPLATAGGGVYMINGSVQHCTIADNTAVRGGVNAGDGLAMTGGTVSNSIVYFNSIFPYQQTQRNVYKTGGTFVYSCTTPAIAGTGNTNAEPQFVDRLAGNYQLLPGSPCIDRGTNLAGVVSDLEGISRPQDGDTLAGAVSDMGAYEALPLTQGVLRCNFIASTNEASGGLSNVSFTAYVAGSDTNIVSYQWDFTNDGGMDLSGAGENPVTNSYAAGFYNVRLTITNGMNEGLSLVKPAYIRVASPVLYVASDGVAELPYDTWGKAATNLNAAVEAAYTVGCTQLVFVTNGVYALDRQLELNGAVVLAGVNGASNTMAVRSGAYVHRLVVLNHAAAIVDGLTLTNGWEDTTAFGGGVLMTAGRLQNCIVTKNVDVEPSTYRPLGGGVYATGGVISNCMIVRNSTIGSYSKAGGLNLNNTVIQNSLIEANEASESPRSGGMIVGGASRVENCLFRANFGSAILASGTTLIRNCTIVEHTAGLGALYMAASSTALNCIVYYNVAPDVSIVAPAVMQYSCTSNAISGVGNIVEVPLFVNRAAGDFRLMPRSPCINAGLMAGWTAGDADLDGRPRIVGGMVDMGAFENQLLSGTVLLIQ